ncbi:hypothetical protein V1477_008848 [Vespula maculifrons]|uniref:Uncharacterized protein n=1 Tax=Vespula maculifrons TaxID=7453 RepID=A0ABD2CEM0_VESMC
MRERGGSIGAESPTTFSCFRTTVWFECRSVTWRQRSKRDSEKYECKIDKIRLARIFQDSREFELHVSYSDYRVCPYLVLHRLALTTIMELTSGCGIGIAFNVIPRACLSRTVGYNVLFLLYLLENWYGVKKVYYFNGVAGCRSSRAGDTIEPSKANGLLTSDKRNDVYDATIRNNQTQSASSSTRVANYDYATTSNIKLYHVLNISLEPLGHVCRHD